MESKFLFKIFSFMVFCLFSNAIVLSSELSQTLSEGCALCSWSGKIYFIDRGSTLDQKSEKNLVEYAVKYNPLFWNTGTHLKVVSFARISNDVYRVIIEGRRKEESGIVYKSLSGDVKRAVLHTHNITVPQSK